jgi:hypothetical protein
MKSCFSTGSLPVHLLREDCVKRAQNHVLQAENDSILRWGVLSESAWFRGERQEAPGGAFYFLCGETSLRFNGSTLGSPEDSPGTYFHASQKAYEPDRKKEETVDLKMN